MNKPLIEYGKIRFKRWQESVVTTSAISCDLCDKKLDTGTLIMVCLVLLENAPRPETICGHCYAIGMHPMELPAITTKKVETGDLQ